MRPTWWRRVLCGLAAIAVELEDMTPRSAREAMAQLAVGLLTAVVVIGLLTWLAK
jgi:hypothetical protein